MTIEIVQISDLHLFADAESRLKGVPTRASLEEVLRWIDQGVASGRWNFEHVVVSGDLTHDEQHETYLMLRELLGDWLPRCLVIPGNHDDRDLLRDVFPLSGIEDAEYLGFSVRAGAWRLLGIDSHLPGEVAGYVDPRQLDWFRAEAKAHDGPVLAFVHHPPFPVGSDWIDKIGPRNADEVLRAFAECGNVRAVSCGHVHQAHDIQASGMRLLTTPSTSIQFQPGTDTLATDMLAPGFRIFRLDGDQFETEVVRLPELKYAPQDDPAAG